MKARGYYTGGCGCACSALLMAVRLDIGPDAG